jgi:hypothetical protein
MIENSEMDMSGWSDLALGRVKEHLLLGPLQGVMRDVHTAAARELERRKKDSRGWVVPWTKRRDECLTKQRDALWRATTDMTSGARDRDPDACVRHLYSAAYTAWWALEEFRVPGDDEAY